MDILKTLQDYEYIQPPKSEEVDQRITEFTSFPEFEGDFPEYVISVKASPSSEPLDSRTPETKISYVKMEMVSYNMEHFFDNKYSKGPINPENVSKIRSMKTYSFILPTSNIHIKGFKSVRDSFRKVLNDVLKSDEFRLSSRGPRLIDVLFVTENNKHSDIFYEVSDYLKIDACSCGHGYEQGGIQISRKTLETECPHCGRIIYASDFLGVDGNINDLGDATSSVHAALSVIEHLIPIQYVLTAYFEKYPFNKVAFVLNGSLALFNAAKKITNGFQAFYYNLSRYLKEKSTTPFIVFGYHSKGQVIDYIKLHRKHINDASYMLLNDKYRYDFIRQSTLQQTFGQNECYGQDFIITTQGSKFHVVTLPYPVKTRLGISDNFLEIKTNPDNYETLVNVLYIVKELEDSKFDNLIIPLTNSQKSITMTIEERVKADKDIQIKNNQKNLQEKNCFSFLR